jgi:preprotein translocase subunit SecA
MGAGDERWGRLLGWLRGENVSYDLSLYEQRVGEILDWSAKLSGLDDQELEGTFARLRRSVAGKPTSLLDELLVEVYAHVYESARRHLGLEAFEEQLIAAIVLHESGIAEMATGEGKTLVAVFPAVLNALAGRGVHILTPNEYLAGRDAAWMGPVYEGVGLDVSVITAALEPRERSRAYGANVTYATAIDVGFDVLRDDLVLPPQSRILRPLFMGIYDDVDSTLIDEARHPLVVAGEDADPGEARQDLAQLLRGLDQHKHWDIDEFGNAAFLTDAGSERVEQVLDCGDLYGADNVGLLTQVNLALHAQALVHRDVDYIVRNGQVELIDEHRGRVAKGRRWPYGLQGAVEDKEGVLRSPPSRVLATSTLQSLAQLYPRKAGMSATAYRAADEFGALYGLKVVYIPPHRKSIREDLPDRIFTHAQGRDEALIETLAQAHRGGRPVLVGTKSVEASEALGAALRSRSIDCQVLNAKNDAREADIIARAGEVGAVTISTSMAGRGTDIRLGGVDEEKRGNVAELGGLLVLGQGRADSTRIDDQLRGRAGRQGDPGASQMYVSLQDELIVRHGVRELLPTKWQDARRREEVMDSKVSAEIDRAQRIVAARNASTRRTVYLCEGYLERQRRLIQKRRRQVLGGGEAWGGILAETSPELFEQRRREYGAPLVASVERRLTLAHIDRAWSRHLERIADARESLQLMAVGVSIGTGFGRQKPLDAFRRQARDSYEEMEYEIDEGIVESFERGRFAETGIDVEELGLSPPKKTWTYLTTELPIETQPKLRLVPSLLKSMINKMFGQSTPAGDRE